MNHDRTPQPRVAVRERLLDLMSNLPAFMSTGGQIHMYLDTPQPGTSFAVPLDSPYLRAWLTLRLNRENHPAPTDSQITQALRVRESGSLGCTNRSYRARVDLRYAWNPQQSAFVLALDTEKALHASITENGWTVQPTPSAFLYEPTHQPIPTPVAPPDNDLHQALQPLRKLLHLDAPAHDSAWQTLLHWTLNAMRAPKDPNFHSYPILNLISSDDNAKSVATRLLTQLIDPTLTPVHSLPATERRLHALAAVHHVLAFPDTGKINPEKSRHLSRLAGGVASLHPKLQGTLVRPIILATTGETETQHLATKVVDVELPPNPGDLEETRRRFEELRPQFLGALLSLLVDTFDNPTPLLPNRKTKNQKIEESVTTFLKENGNAWTGTITDLLHRLNLPPTVSPKYLSQFLDDTTTAFQVQKTRKNKARLIHLELPAQLSSGARTTTHTRLATIRPNPRLTPRNTDFSLSTFVNSVSTGPLMDSSNVYITSQY